MPTPRKHATNAARQAAYRARLAAPPPCGGPLPARQWGLRLGQAQALLEAVAAAMAVYAAARTAAWHDSERGDQFAERQEALDEAISLLRDLAEA